LTPAKYLKGKEFKGMGEITPSSRLAGNLEASGQPPDGENA